MFKKIISILTLVILMTTLYSCKPENTEETNASTEEMVHSGGSNNESAENAPEIEIGTANNAQSNLQAHPKPEPQPDTQTDPDTPVSNTNDAVTDSTPESNTGASQDGEMSSPSFAGTAMTYEEYNALTAEKQQEYFNSFESVEKFFDWYNAAKAEYEKDYPTIEIGPDGSIDLNKIENGKK